MSNAIHHVLSDTELYERVVVKPVRALCDFFWHHVDELVIDGLVNGLARACKEGGNLVRRLQSGRLPQYLAAMALGLTAILGWIFYL